MNVFPVTVTDPDGTTHREARLYDGSVYVWDATAQSGVAIWTGVFDGPQRGPWTMETPEGAVTVTRGGGCGCSAPMKRWLPGGRPVRRFDERR